MNTVIIFASGPSLSSNDCIRAKQSGLPVIAVNSTWQAIPSCNYIYASDLAWWANNIALLPSEPEKWTSSRQAHERYQLNYHEPQYPGSFNSGLRAIMFAESLGAKNIILSGYDCSIKYGTHWHGDHALSGNPTELLTQVWCKQFEQFNNYFTHNLNIINCSRMTSLSCFRIDSFEECIDLYQHSQ